jgi:glycosyltransferase involved in cell wall biosynthesis
MSKSIPSDLPLVSIIVVVYNSSKYVLETLESAKTQMYQNIELIITDDYSTDDTVEICRKWLENNSERFVRTELIIAKKNTGITANCNRGIKVSNGEWLKLSAGDDLFLPNCIVDNIEFVKLNPEARFIVSDSLNFYNDSGKSFEEKHDINFVKLNAKKQYTRLLRGMLLVKNATSFIHRESFQKLGFFNEDYVYIEDYPYSLKVTKSNYRFFYLNKLTVKYRIHDDSAWGSVINPNQIMTTYKKVFLKDYILLYETELLPGLLKYHLYHRYISAYIQNYLLKTQLYSPEKYKIRKFLRCLDVFYVYRVAPKLFCKIFSNE